MSSVTIAYHDMSTACTDKITHMHISGCSRCTAPCVQQLHSYAGLCRGNDNDIVRVCAGNVCSQRLTL